MYFKINDGISDEINAQISLIKAIMAEDVRQNKEEEGDMVKGLVEFENAAEEWSNVTEVTAKFQNQDEGDKEVILEPPVTPLVTVDKVVEHLRRMEDMETLLGQVKGHEQPRGRASVMRRLLCCLHQPRPLPPHQRLTVKLIQASALISFSNEVNKNRNAQSINVE